MALNNKSKPCGALLGKSLGNLWSEEVIFKSGKNRIFLLVIVNVEVKTVVKDPVLSLVHYKLWMCKKRNYYCF
jgi:hypothetical protein